jgi:hypothetical protein
MVLRHGWRWLAAGCMAAAGALALGLAATGCNAVLGIGAASLDPDAAGSGSGSGGGGRSLSCPYYCSTVVQNCTGDNAEFEGTEDPTAICMSTCPGIDVGHAGTIGPTDDDTLGCRINYAEQAATDPATNCRFSGLGGGERCGKDPCALFCSLAMQYCTSLTKPTPPYGSAAECLADCRGTGDAGGAYPYLLNVSDLQDNGNTLNCRIYHLQNAYGSEASGEFHCPHTGLVSQTCQ